MTKETQDLGAAPPRSLTDSELDELRDMIVFDMIGRTTDSIGPQVQRLVNAFPLLVGDLRVARQRGDVNWKLAQGEQAARLARDAEWISAFTAWYGTDWPERVREERDPAAARLQALLGNAPQAPSDSSAALLEARRLLVEALEWVDGSWDMPDRRLALLKCIRAFLRSDSERSEHGKG